MRITRCVDGEGKIVANQQIQTAPGGRSVYHLKITLQDIDPPIWRRVVVPGDISLRQLHNVIQGAMGWTNSHLHSFLIDGRHYARPDKDWDDLDNMKVYSDTRYRLNRVVPREGVAFDYQYDFGDSWDHTVVVEKIVPHPGSRLPPVCLDGERACPPEDVGGTDGYRQFLDTLRGPDSVEKREYLAWIGRPYDPDLFMVKSANRELKRLRNAV